MTRFCCAGAEYGGYSADVTRTWAVSGAMTSAQRDVYEAVLSVQEAVIGALARRPSLDQLFVLMCSKLGHALKELCLVDRKLSGNDLFRVSCQ